MTTISSFWVGSVEVSDPWQILPVVGYREDGEMAGPADDPYLKELGRRALVELLGAESAQRYLDGDHSDALDDDVFDEPVPDPMPDPVLADFYNGACLRELAAARDGLEQAKVAYELAVVHARAAGWTWAEVARVLGVSKQSLHSRFRGRGPE